MHFVSYELWTIEFRIFIFQLLGTVFPMHVALQYIHHFPWNYRRRFAFYASSCLASTTHPNCTHALPNRQSACQPASPLELDRQMNNASKFRFRLLIYFPANGGSEKKTKRIYGLRCSRKVSLFWWWFLLDSSFQVPSTSTKNHANRK